MRRNLGSFIKPPVVKKPFDEEKFSDSEKEKNRNHIVKERKGKNNIGKNRKGKNRRKNNNVIIFVVVMCIGALAYIWLKK